MLWVCRECNEQKNVGFDERILNPTLDNPHEYLQLTSQGSFDAEPNSRGALTLQRITRLSKQSLIESRAVAFAHIKIVLTELFPVAGNESRAQIRHYVIKSPFGSVFSAILHVSRESNAVEVLGTSLVNVLAQYPEIHNWLISADEERRRNALIEIGAIAQRIRVGVEEEEEA